MKSFGSNSFVIAVAQIKGNSVSERLFCKRFFFCHSTPIWALKWLFKNQVSLFRCLVSKRRLAGVFVFVCRPKRCCARCQFGIRRAMLNHYLAQRKGDKKTQAATAVFSFQVKSPCFWTGILWARTKKWLFIHTSCSYYTFSSKKRTLRTFLWNPTSFHALETREQRLYQIIWLLCK